MIPPGPLDSPSGFAQHPRTAWDSPAPRHWSAAGCAHRWHPSDCWGGAARIWWSRPTSAASTAGGNTSSCVIYIYISVCVWLYNYIYMCVYIICTVLYTSDEFSSVCLSVYVVEWNGMKWNEMEWNEMEWNGMKWNEMEWNGMKWNEMEWNGMKWNEMKWNGMEWNGMKWNEMEWNGNGMKWNEMEWNGMKWTVVLCCVTLCCVTLCYVMLCYVISLSLHRHLISLCDALLSYIPSCHVMLSYVWASINPGQQPSIRDHVPCTIRELEAESPPNNMIHEADIWWIHVNWCQAKPMQILNVFWYLKFLNDLTVFFWLQPGSPSLSGCIRWNSSLMLCLCCEWLTRMVGFWKRCKHNTTAIEAGKWDEAVTLWGTRSPHPIRMWIIERWW